MPALLALTLRFVKRRAGVEQPGAAPAAWPEAAG
jgi:hypothetical protein